MSAREAELLALRASNASGFGYFAILCPLLTLLIAFFGLLGWHLSVPSFLHWDADARPMSYLDSWLLAASGLSVLLIHRRGRIAGLFAVAAAIVLATLSFLPDLERSAAHLFASVLGLRGEEVAHVAPSAASGLLLAAAAVIILRSSALRSRDLFLAGGLSLATLVIGSIGLLANVNRAASGSTLGFESIVDVPFPVGLGQILVGAALLGYSWLAQGRELRSAKKPLRLMVLYAICGVFVIAVFSAALGMSPLYQFMTRVDQERMSEVVALRASEASGVLERFRSASLDAAVKLRSGLPKLPNAGAPSIDRALEDVFARLRSTEPSLLGACVVLGNTECAASRGEAIPSDLLPASSLVRQDAAFGPPVLRNDRLAAAMSVPLWNEEGERVGTTIFLYDLQELSKLVAVEAIGRRPSEISLIAQNDGDSVTVIAFPSGKGSWVSRVRTAPGYLELAESALRGEGALLSREFSPGEKQLGVVAPIKGSTLSLFGLFDAAEVDARVSGVLRRVATGVLSLVGVGCLVLFLILREMTLRVEELQAVLRERTDRLRRELELKKQTEQELIAYREQLEERVLQRSEELQQSRRKLRETERLASLGSLVSGFAHDLGPPLAAVLMTTQNALDAAPKTKDRGKLIQLYEETCKKVILHTRRMGGIVRGVLQFADGDPEERAVTDINLLMHTVVRRLQTSEVVSSVALDIDFDEHTLPALVHPLEMEQALSALFTFIFHSGRDVSRVRVQTREAGETVEIEVVENGPTLSRAQRAALTGATRRSTDSTFHLSVVRDLILSQKGEIRVHSAYGEPNAYLFVLPLYAQSELSEPEPERAVGS